MGQVISVVSGKGGTGKTSLCAGIAGCLAAEGKCVLCIDVDVGLRNLDIALGMSEESVVTFTAVMRGEYTLAQAAENRSIPGLFLLTAPICEAPEDIDAAAFSAMLRAARERFDFILLDAAAGIGKSFRLAADNADYAIVVSGADPASLRDAARTAELLPDGLEARLAVNRIGSRLFSQLRSTVDDVMDAVGLPLLGIVPDDGDVTLAAAAGMPLIVYTGQGAARACLNMARRLCGRKMPLMHL